MTYTMYMIVAIVAVLAYIEISSLKKQVRALQERVDALAQATGNEALASLYVPEDVRARTLALKKDGRPVEAVKVVREATGMSLEDAKTFVDGL